MEYEIEVKGKMITIEHEDFKNRINFEDLTSINPSNIFGESSTISGDVGKIGLMKAEVYAMMQEAKLEISIYESDYKKKLRAQASKNSGKYIMKYEGESIEVKLTEKALDTCFESEPDWKKLKMTHITLEKYWNDLDSMYWSAQDKSKKLNGMVATINPEKFKDNVAKENTNSVITE